jgi:RNA polymerase sigma-70 factor (ECF subfamily)
MPQAATTRWSLILAARHPETPDGGAALAGICESYWYPVYAFIRRQGYHADEAGDLTQAFFARLIEKEYLRQATPARGRFRSFLFASVRHFLSNERDRARALKRGGVQGPVSLDLRDAEGRFRLEPADGITPERLFDRQWALALLERVLARLDAELEGRGHFDRLKGFLTGDGAEDYHDAAAALGMSEGAVKVAVHRLRRRYRERVRREVARLVADPSLVDEEIRHLIRALTP